MSKVSKLITQIRDTLNDPDGDRWDDNRLIRSINETVSDINQKSRVLRAKGKVTLTSGISTYILEMDIQLITRILYDGKNLVFKSHQEMDELGDTWEEDIGDEVEYIVYDHLNRSQIRTYPIMASDISEISGEYGIITSLDGITFNTPYGIMTSLYEPTGDMVIYYIKKPQVASDVDDDIELDDIWDKAIKHGVCGNVLRDDKDTQNRAFGGEELQLYAMELQSANRDASHNFQTASAYETKYRSL